MLPAVYEATKA